MRLHVAYAGGAAAVLLAILAGCASKPKAPPSAQAEAASTAAAKPKGYYKIGTPYQVEGAWYYPGVDYGYDETGIASWYGPDFHGKFTANGELYDMNDLTAAHPTLPLPSVVRVTNLENGRSIVVRVNDRGPYVRGRIIDLSRRAAQLIGMIGTGTAKVRVQVLADESHQVALLAQQGEIPPVERIAAAVPPPKVTAQELAPPSGVARAPTPPPTVAAPRVAAQPRSNPLIPSAEAAAPNPPVQIADLAPPKSLPPANDNQVRVVAVKPSSIFVQVGAFGQYDNANRLRAKLLHMGPSKITQVNVDGQPFFRVRLGPTASVADADSLLDQVVKAGYHDARIVVE
jgi:rare lipoprotein A